MKVASQMSTAVAESEPGAEGWVTVPQVDEPVTPVATQCPAGTFRVLVTSAPGQPSLFIARGVPRLTPRPSFIDAIIAREIGLQPDGQPHTWLLQDS